MFVFSLHSCLLMAHFRFSIALILFPDSGHSLTTLVICSISRFFRTLLDLAFCSQLFRFFSASSGFNYFRLTCLFHPAFCIVFLLFFSSGFHLLLPALPFSGLRPSLKGEECNQALFSGSIISSSHALRVLSAIALRFSTSLWFNALNLLLLFIRLLLQAFTSGSYYWYFPAKLSLINAASTYNPDYYCYKQSPVLGLFRFILKTQREAIISFRI